MSLLVVKAGDIPDRPYPPKLVNDYTGILKLNEVNQLERKLVAYNDTTSTQIVIVIVPSLNGHDKSDFAYSLGEKWGVGQKGFNNGIIILVKPKTYSKRGETFIATGYGLESVVPDAIAKRIVEKEMIPNFKSNNYYKGLDNATSVLISLASGEFTAKDYKKRTEASPFGMLIPIIIIALTFILMVMSNARSYSVGKNLPFWAAFFLLMSGGGRSSGSTWNDFSSGSGDFGGGGGFGGFGGGSFGGGGAGGSW